MNFLKWGLRALRACLQGQINANLSLLSEGHHFKKFITYQPLNIFPMCKRKSCRELVKL